MKNHSIIEATMFALTAVVVTLPAVWAGDAKPDGLHIGWASTSITPDEPVIMSGGSRARLSTGVMDPLTATALVLESARDGKPAEQVVLVSVDLGSVHTDMLERVQEIVSERVPEIDPKTVVMSGTHTHAAVERRQDPPLVERFAELGIQIPLEWSWWGMDLGVKPSPGEYFEFASRRIANCSRHTPCAVRSSRHTESAVRSSRHTECAVRGVRHTECAYYFGIAQLTTR